MRLGRALRRVVVALLALVVGVAIVLVGRTLAFRSRQLTIEPIAETPVPEGAVARLQHALTFVTVSAAGADHAPFAAFRGFLQASFPRLHQALERELVGDALLYTWRGSDPALAPIVLMAHQDVVPAEPARWTHPPFAGDLKDGYVWGRGALDDKGALCAILEAVEQAVGEGFRPRRTVLLAFGADEEVGGAGAQAIAARLKDRGVRPAWVLDEGMAVTQGIVPGVSDSDGSGDPGKARPVALIAIAEKGYLTVELSANGESGHSSMPPRHTAVGRLGRALERLEAHPFPAVLDGPGRALFEWLGPELPFARRLALANLWLLGPVVRAQLAAAPATDALLRTTTAATLIEGGVKDNVLPARARALVNFRIRPGDTIAGVLDHVRAVVDDPEIAIAEQRELRSEPSAVSPLDGPGFQLLQRTLGEVFPQAIVAPTLTLGATDARHLQPLTDGIYRFYPFTLRPGDPARVHGVDERVAPADYARAIRFYRRLLQSAAG